MRDGSKSGAVSYVLALDSESGKQHWKIDRPRVHSGWSTPIVLRSTEDAAPQLVTFSPNRLSGYRLDDGKRLWSIGQLPHDSVATPAVGDGLIFVSGTVFGGDVENPFRLPAYGELLKEYDKNKDKRLERAEVPAVSIDPRGRLDQSMTLRHVFDGVDRDKNKVATFFEWTAARVFVALTSRPSGGGGKDELVAVKLPGEGEAKPSVAWSFDKAIPDNPSPLYYKGHVFLAKSGGIVTRVDAKTGKAVKRKRISVTGKISASPIAANDRFYICTEDGDVVVLDASGQLKQLGHASLNERIMATPAIAADRLYVRTDGHLFAFGSSDASKD
jgi:outer membrane protein assembly factor BamB